MTMFFNQSYWVLLSHNEWLPTFEVQLYDRSGHMDPYYVPDKNSLRLPNENQTFPNVVGGIDRDGWWSSELHGKVTLPSMITQCSTYTMYYCGK